MCWHTHHNLLKTFLHMSMNFLKQSSSLFLQCMSYDACTRVLSIHPHIAWFVYRVFVAKIWNSFGQGRRNFWHAMKFPTQSCSLFFSRVSSYACMCWPYSLTLQIFNCLFVLFVCFFFDLFYFHLYRILWLNFDIHRSSDKVFYAPFHEVWIC